MACSKMTFPCDLPQLEREVSVVHERKAIPHSLGAMSRVPADSIFECGGGRWTPHADLVLHFKLQELDLPARVGQASDGARLAAAEAGNRVRSSGGGSANGVRSPNVGC
jgi:hypothetical protein